MLEYAPAAATQAAAASAHREAVSLYALALRCAADLSVDSRVRLLEAYAMRRNATSLGRRPRPLPPNARSCNSGATWAIRWSRVGLSPG